MTTASRACPICGGAQHTDPATTPRVTLRRCRACHHRTALHAGAAGEARDYHAQYDQEGFLSALRATRVRQARAIVALLRSHDPGVRSILDFGCGRGWFLDEAAAQGFDHLAGADSSEIAVELQARAGRAAVRVPLEAPGDLDLRALPFTVEVLALLDVVEHFPPDRARTIVASLVERLRPELRWVIVKVPVSTGLLYRTAAALARAGVHGPLEQLYQAGTTPPHLGYFTATSLRLLLEGAGLEVVALEPDRDFEPETFADRVTALRRAPRVVGRLAGSMLAAVADGVGWQDSVVAFARPLART